MTATKAKMRIKGSKSTKRIPLKMFQQRQHCKIDYLNVIEGTYRRLCPTQGLPASDTDYASLSKAVGKPHKRGSYKSDKPFCCLLDSSQ